jgi:membrane protein YdbS with pleckstrin-like domain
MRKLPLDFGIFWKTFAVVVVLVIAAWWVAIRFGFYDAMTPADYVGTTISTILFSYLVHLWILPADVLRGEHGGTEEEAKEEKA